MSDMVPLLLREGSASGRALEVHQVWGETLLATRTFGPGHGAVQIGLDPGHRWRFLGIDMGPVSDVAARVLPWVAPLWSEVDSAWRSDFTVDADLLADGRWTLFRVGDDGEVVLRVQEGWDGFVEDADGRRSFGSLEGTPVDGGIEVRVPDGARVVVEAAGSVFVAHRATPALRHRSVSSDGVDYALGGVTAASVCLFLAVAALVWSTPPTRESATRAEEPELVELRLDTPPKDPEVRTAGGSGSRAKNREGASGDKTPRPTKKRARSDRDVAATSGLLSVLSDPRFALGGSTLDMSLTMSVAGLQGSMGGGPGSGLGDRGDGLGGGGDAESLGDIDTGGPGSGREYGVPGGPPKSDGEIDIDEPPILIGQLHRSEIDEVVKRSLPALKYCYQRELQRNPGLDGKVVTKFSIASDGSVSAAKVKTSTLENAAVESCLQNRFLRMQFPAPKGGGVVVVSYPLTFSSK